MDYFAPFGGKEQFIAKFSAAYYCDSEEVVIGAAGKRVAKNSRLVENQMDTILAEGIKGKRDVIRILAWKIGKIKHPDVVDENRFVYHSDWLEAEEHPEKIKRYGKPFQIDGFAQDIADNIKCLEEKEPQWVLNWLNDKAPRGIGTVYMLTLLYFISRGQCPIYDKFAKMAIDAIQGGAAVLDNHQKKPEICYRELPSRSDDEFETIYKDRIEGYKCDIDRIFGYENYKEDRNIDRALWVYGHYFKPVK